MLTCANCQFVNPADHKFCQRCGEPLAVPATEMAAKLALQVRLMPPHGAKLIPATYLNPSLNRYQVLTVLSEGCAYISDTTPDVRSPLQQQLAQISQPTLDDLEAIHDLPKAAYPYLLLDEAAPPLHDAWRQDDTDLLIVFERPALSSVIRAFSTAVDPLQHVYWMYRLTELWAALAPVPQWRSSLLLADNLGIDSDQSLRIQKFIAPITDPISKVDSPVPQLFELKVFLKSLLAQPHRGTIATLRQNRQLILAVSSAQTLEQLSEELADIGEALLATPEAITPFSTAAPTAAAGFTSGLSSSTPTASTPAASTPLAAPLAPLLPVPTTMPPHALSSTAPDSEDALDDQSQETILQDSIDADALDGLAEEDEATIVLPMKLVALNDAGQTHVGQQRDHNEDCFLIARESRAYADNKGQVTTACGLYILCDGMGGHDGGEVASTLAAKTLKQYFEKHWPLKLDLEVSEKAAEEDAEETPRSLPDEEMMIEAVKLANQAVYDVNEQEQRAGHERMGTTLVVVLLQGTSAVVAHVGDSRLYQHSRRLGLRQVTIDHEVGQREIQRGIAPAEAYARPDAYQLTQALGPRDKDDLEPDVSYLNFSEDTLLLLCSDGLSDNDVVEDYLDSHIAPLLVGTQGLAAGMNDLVQLSNEVNGHDNITAIAIRLEVSPDLAKGAFDTAL
ncbi:MAG: serine/threonine phosphatase [Phormidesmis sp.]